MTLKMLGSEVQDVAPWVFVQCASRAKRRIHSYFQRPNVQSDFRPLNPTTELPRFDVYIHPGPVRRNDEIPSFSFGNDTWPPPSHDIVVWCKGTSLDNCTSLHGITIYANVRGSFRSATLGGIVGLYRGTTMNFFGLTAGHVFDEAADGCEDDNDEDDESDYSDSDGYSIDGMNSTDVHEGIVYNLHAEDLVAQQADSTIYDSSIQNGFVIFGKLSTAASRYRADRPDPDWALVQINIDVFESLNIIDYGPAFRQPANLQAQTSLAEENSVKNVVMSSERNGSAKGTLSVVKSHLELSSKTMAGVYSVNILEGSGKGSLYISMIHVS